MYWYKLYPSSWPLCVDTSNPSDTHFVTWRPDIPPHYLGDLVRHVRGVLPDISPARKAKMSMHTLINQYTEKQSFFPFPPSPSRMLNRPDQGHSPIKRGQVVLETLFDFSQPIEIPDTVLSEEESLQFSEKLDRVEAEMEAAFGEVDVAGMKALQDALQQQLRREESDVASQSGSQHSAQLFSTTDLGSDPTSTSPPQPSSTVDSIFLDPSLPSPESPRIPIADKITVPAQLFTWQIGKTEHRLINGALRKSCLGRGCFGKSGMKSNDNCSHKLCKGCCAMYQHEVSTSCKEAGHKPPSKDSALASSSSLYVHTRPLQPLHYERREHAHLDHHDRLKILQNQQIFANDVRKNIHIKFWNSEGGQMDMLTVESPTYPYFCIGNCSTAVRQALGATDGKLVRIFDPQTRNWVLEESSNKRFANDGEILLVHPRSCTTGIGMQEAEEEEVNPSITLSASPSPVRALAPIWELSDSPDLSSMTIPLSRPSTPSPAPKLKKAKIVKTEEEEVIDLTVPNSRHAAWPWKFYKGMHDGFVQLDKKGSKHTDVFPLTTAKTKALARAAWTAGTPELKAKFYTDSKSTWKAYVNAVKELHGGTIPSHSELKKSKVPVQAGPLNVRHEMIEIDVD
ncbi:hypothetical protein DFH05DRAFT_1528533 [Lentinula detonsa]|uniref:Uncharacterized protein n=1 Tax=Lentinula detonsa TaxID=2804962 RepID=A0A9W8NTZ7_9AGAR|nr:hypothetical protein DFH05DRAFT_1528533 [Lentinula detonsa]